MTTPYIPAGWKREQLDTGYALYTEPQYGGLVTVDYIQRTFRTGFTTIGPRDTTNSYGGRGWKARLEQDATAHLHAAVNSK